MQCPIIVHAVNDGRAMSVRWVREKYNRSYTLNIIFTCNLQLHLKINWRLYSRLYAKYNLAFSHPFHLKYFYCSIIGYF
jgi:hypothetical protein